MRQNEYTSEGEEEYSTESGQYESYDYYTEDDESECFAFAQKDVLCSIQDEAAIQMIGYC